MNNKRKYIGIEQRIPIEVYEEAMHLYFREGTVDKEYIVERIQQFNAGKNRAAKAALSLLQIIKRQSGIIDLIKKSSPSMEYYRFSPDERKALGLCLISLSYPIMYDLLIALSQGLKTQPQINKLFISEKVKIIYGSNRIVDVAIDALLPMIIELNTIRRDKISLYSKAEILVVNNRLISEIVLYTDIKLSGTKSIMLDDIGIRPWMNYFELTGLKIDNTTQLFTLKDSTIGNGYLTI